MPLAFEEAEAAVAEAGFGVVRRYGDGPMGSWDLTLDHDPPLRLIFDGRDRWLTIEWLTDRFWGDARVWDPLWIGKSEHDLNAAMVRRMLASVTEFADATAEARSR